MGYQYDKENDLLLIEVQKNFVSEDFETLSRFIEEHYQQHGEFRGLILNSKKFPYWKGARNRAEYFSFAANNHYKFKKVALAMNGFMAKIITTFANGRAHPKIKNFNYNKIRASCSWLLS